MKVFLYRKNNAVRFIAIVLAFIMLAVPFFAHAGFKGDSKAEEGGDGDTQKKYKYNTTVTLDNVISNPSIAYENGKLIIKSGSGYINSPTTDHTYDSKYVDVYVNKVTNSVSGDIAEADVPVGSETKKLSASLSNCDVYYKTNIIDSNYVPWTDGSSLQIPAGNSPDQIIYVFYIKVNVYETVGSDKNLYGEVYVPLKNVKFTNTSIEENGRVPVPCFKNGGSEISPNYWYKSAVYNDPSYIKGQFKYGYLKDGTFVEATNGKTISATGVYTPCARYFTGTTYSADNVIKDFEGTPVIIDADEPDFDLYIVKKDAYNSEIVTSVEKNGDTFEPPYVNKEGSTLYLRVVTNDGTGVCASGIQEVSVSSAGGSTTVTNVNNGVYDADINGIAAGTDITITVKDNAGNITTKTMQYIEDKNPPMVSEQKVYLTDGTLDEELDDSDSSKWYGQGDKSVKLTAIITEDNLDSVKLYIKEPGEGKVYIQYPDDNISLTNDSADNTITNVTVILPHENYNSSGKYSFYFVAYDKAGNKCGGIDDEKTFWLDNTEPEAKIISYELRMSNDNGTTWGEWTSWSPDANIIYRVNKDLIGTSIEYRITVEARDEHSDYDAGNSGKLNADGTVDTTNNPLKDITGTSANPAPNNYKVLEYIIKPDDVSDTNKPITIRISDNVGNYTDVTTDDIAAATKEISFFNNTLKIYETGNPGNSIDLSSFANGNLDININKSYTIEIDAYSGYKITSAKLLATISEAIDATTDLTIDGNVDNLKFDTLTGRYTATITYVVPGEKIYNIKNEWLQEIELSVTDNRNNGVTPPVPTNDTAKIKIGKILYDMSLPRIDKLKILKDGTEEAIANKWYQKADLAYTIVSKPIDTSIESGLSWISWEITRSEKNDSGKVNLKGEKEYYATIDVPESENINGTLITFNAEDRAANGIYTENDANIAVIKVDKQNPGITSLTVNDKKNNEHTASYGILPVVKVSASDNLTLDKIVIEVTYPDGVVRGYTKTVGREEKNLTDSASYRVEQVNGKVLDGTYKASAYAVDKSGRKSSVSENSFVIDMTKPVVTAKIIEGTVSPKTVVPYYYNDNVGIELTYEDANILADSIAVTDNGNAIGNIKWEPVSGTSGKYRAVMYVSDEGSHSITINAKDTSGNAAVESKQEFAVDKTKPQITAYVNGTTVYNDSMGNMMLTGNTSVAFNISDATADIEDCYVQVQRSTPSEGAGNPAYVKTANTDMSFGEEGDYVVNFYTIDRACNSSDVKTVRFRIDKTSPELSISGAAGGTSANASTVTFTMRETFWNDADATVAIYRKASDGAAEQLYKTLTFNPSAYQTSMSETLTETGVYRFEFEAGDNVGHHSELSQTLIIDRDAPVVTLTGVKDYDMTDGAVEFMVEITDDFYSSKKVGIKGTRTDRDGKVNKLDFGTFLQSTNPTVISKTFDEEGIYFITLETEDAAGNRHTNTVHFVIDNSAPVIGDLSKYDGKIFTSFSWDEDLDELVSDLTVCDVQMFLNGSEYDGVSDIEDGSYVLLIVATDEMGHKTEKEARFELDTKAPVFIITGVEDGEVKNENYAINVSLQLDEDTLESVVLNGVNISVKNNTATINVTEKGEYTLELKAHDAAGNEATETITFKYGEEKTLWWLWIVIACCVLLAGTITIIVVKKKKEQ